MCKEREETTGKLENDQNKGKKKVKRNDDTSTTGRLEVIRPKLIFRRELNHFLAGADAIGEVGRSTQNDRSIIIEKGRTAVVRWTSLNGA